MWVLASIVKLKSRWNYSLFKLDKFKASDKRAEDLEKLNALSLRKIDNPNAENTRLWR